MKLTKLKQESNNDDYKQKLFELKLELLCEYKKMNPDKIVYLDEFNLNMVLEEYKNLLINK